MSAGYSREDAFIGAFQDLELKLAAYTTVLEQAKTLVSRLDAVSPANRATEEELLYNPDLVSEQVLLMKLCNLLGVER